MKTNTRAGHRLAKILAAMGTVATCLTASPAMADDAAMQAAATSTRARWDTIVGQQRNQSAGVIAPKFTSPPVINSVSIFAGTNVKVGTYPAPVRINFNITSANGVRDILVDVRSRDFKQGQRRQVTLPFPHTSGAISVETGIFTAHNQPGTYDLRFVGVCDVTGLCTELDYYSTAPDATRAFTVTNTRTPDTNKPTITSAVLNTKALTTHSTGVALLYLKFGLSDIGTGATGVSVCARPASEAYEVCGYWDLPVAVRNNTQWVTIPFEGNTQEPGTWHIAVVEIVDRVGNQLFEIDPTALDTMFPGGRTFTLTNGS